MPREEGPPAAIQTAEVAEGTRQSPHLSDVLRETRGFFEVSNGIGGDDWQESEQLQGLGGLQSLPDAEVVSILLRKEKSGRSSVVEMARQITARMSSLAGVRKAGDLVLRQMGRGNAATLLAAVELGRRLARAEMMDHGVLEQPEAMAAYLTFRYARPDQEVMGALYFDSCQRLIAEREIFCGTLSRTAVEPRTILKQALMQGAAGFILFHSHPSGDPTPSDEDLSFTRRMVEAGDLLGVRLLDHLVLGGGRWVSLSNAQALQRT